LTKRVVMAEPNKQSSTVLGPDAVFKGQLEFEKDVLLLGRFEGDINSGGRLKIEESGSLKGNAKSAHIEVKGVVTGNLEAAKKVELGTSARMEGDLRTSRLEVQEGAVLVGHCTVGINGESKPSQSAKAPPDHAQETTGKPKEGQAPQPTGKK